MGVLHDKHHGTSGFTKFVYFVFVINVLAFLLLIIGAIGGWFRIEADRLADGTYHMGLVFDSEEASSDVDETVNAASNMSETAGSASDLETLDGEVKSVDPEQERLTFVSAGASYDVKLTEATKFDGDAWTSIGDIQPGQQMRITMQQNDNQNFAVKISDKREVLTP